jgi:hypothetical protein
MSADNKVRNGSKKGKEKYMWLGFGNYSGGGVQGPINPGIVRADPGIFDRLFELFGLKEKTSDASRESAEDERDPSW